VNHPKVMLVGGAPGIGKTTLGRALAARLETTSLSTDDLHAAAKAVTSPGSHPGIHVMARKPSVLYFTETPAEQLIADADAQHEAMWPAVEKVIRNHLAWGSPIVIDGWVLRPDWVAKLELGDRVGQVWLVADPGVLEARERANPEFFSNSPDPARMLENFLARSRWFNALVESQAAEQGAKVLRQNGQVPVEALCREALT